MNNQLTPQDYRFLKGIDERTRYNGDFKDNSGLKI